ncbi:SEC14 cytosolic factor isoform X2 [Folsomia candida]|nr:SEC14 cytosolic factor isoform X2 [Folsomia candida]
MQCISVEEDLTLTRSEKKALDELKLRVEKNLPNDYMKKEVYLINWIRASDGNVDQAVKMLKANLKWRKQNKMDNILREDFSYMEEEYPIDLSGVDYTGRPVLLVRVGDWDVRRSHVTGEHDENYRYSIRALELASQKVRDAQARGKLVTRFQVIFNMDGFSLVQHGCLQCIPPYLNFLRDFQNYFPGMVDNLVFINAPQSMKSIIQYFRPIVRPSFRKILHIFGTDPAEWKPFLFKIIPSDQIEEHLERGKAQK